VVHGEYGQGGADDAESAAEAAAIAEGEWRDLMARVTEEARDGLTDELPARLCAACVRVLPVAGASVSLVSGGARATLCATDETATRLAEIQYTLGEGPSLRAGSVRAPVSAVDLTSGRDAQWWPLFARQAVSVGAVSAFSFPLGQGGGVLGTMDLYGTTAGALGERGMVLALRAADAVTMALATLQDQQCEEPMGSGVAWWVQAEANHEEVYKATGMLMVRLGVNADEALARLRARAFSLDRTVTEVARDITTRRDGFGASD